MNKANKEFTPTKFVMNRDFMVKGFGHEVGFIKDVPIHVPAILHAEAMRCGATPLDPENVNHVQKEQGRQPEIQGEERADTITRAMDKLVADNARLSFGADGLPTLKALFRLTGIDLELNERNAIWKVRAKALASLNDPNSATITKEEEAEIAKEQSDAEDKDVAAEGAAIAGAEGPGTEKVVLAEEGPATKGAAAETVTGTAAGNAKAPALKKAAPKKKK